MDKEKEKNQMIEEYKRDFLKFFEMKLTKDGADHLG